MHYSVSRGLDKKWTSNTHYVRKLAPPSGPRSSELAAVTLVLACRFPYWYRFKRQKGTAFFLYTDFLIGTKWMQLIAWKDGDKKLLIDPEGYKCLTNASNLRADAESIYELYTDPSPIFKPGSVWKDIVLDPSRPTVQSELKTSILNIEKSWLCFLPNGWCYAINFELFYSFREI